MNETIFTYYIIKINQTANNTGSYQSNQRFVIVVYEVTIISQNPSDIVKGEERKSPITDPDGDYRFVNQQKHQKTIPGKIYRSCIRTENVNIVSMIKALNK